MRYVIGQLLHSRGIALARSPDRQERSLNSVDDHGAGYEELFPMGFFSWMGRSGKSILFPIREDNHVSFIPFVFFPLHH